MADMKYGVWYEWSRPEEHNAWSHIKVDQIDENPPTTYHLVNRCGNRRKPEDAGFWAVMVDSRDRHLSYYGPPMVDPEGWRPGQTPHRTGEDYLKWLEKLIADGELVEATKEPQTRPR